MIRVSVFNNEISSDGEIIDGLGASFEIKGQELTLVEGSARYIQVGIPVYSELYGRQIDFDTDGEEWGRNLSKAYRNGAVVVEVEEVAEAAHGRQLRKGATLALNQERRLA